MNAIRTLVRAAMDLEPLSRPGPGSWACDANPEDHAATLTATALDLDGGTIWEARDEADTLLAVWVTD